MEQFQLELGPVRKVYTVGELNTKIRGVLDRSFGDIWITGEISGVKLPASGHYYFTLKEGGALLQCVCYRMQARYLRFKPQDGVAVVARGRLEFYDARGQVQLLVEYLEPQGRGALQFAFEQLKTNLAMEGLFDAARKRTLPKLPRRIGIVTSPQGAVVQDMVNVLSRRFPGIWIRVFPALVQGEGSVEQVVRGLRYFSQSAWAEVVIVARGGGSLEDLWTFNEEAVARAIVASSVPVISAIGHETDFTISDFVADLRAPTPSAAAELVICTRQELFERIEGCRRHLEQILRYRISMAARRLHQQGVDRASTVLHRRVGRHAQRVDDLQRCLADTFRRRIRAQESSLAGLLVRLRQTDLRVRLAAGQSRLESLERRLFAAGPSVMARQPRLRQLTELLQQSVARAVNQRRQRLALASSSLSQLSPLAVLDRGYAIVRRTYDGRVVRSPDDVEAGTELRVRVRDGELIAEVTQAKVTQ